MNIFLVENIIPITFYVNAVQFQSENTVMKNIAVNVLVIN